MIVPTIEKRSEQLTPKEREDRYGVRSLAELRKDTNELWTWRATALTEKNRMDSDILSLKRRYNASLIFSILAFLGTGALAAWAIWG
jgi:hypothetical protein